MVKGRVVQPGRSPQPLLSLSSFLKLHLEVTSDSISFHVVSAASFYLSLSGCRQSLKNYQSYITC